MKQTYRDRHHTSELDVLLRLLAGSAERSRQPAHTRDFPGMASQTIFRFAASSGFKTAVRANGYVCQREFVILPSSRAPRWLLPVGSASRAASGLDIYTPYGRFGRGMKRVAGILFRRGWKGSLRERVLVASQHRFPLENLVSELTGEPDPVFSFSLGTPERFRKLTVRAMAPDGAVLGYLKLPLTESAAERIRHEAAVLNWLGQSGLKHQVPRLLHSGPWDGGYLLFQSPLEGEPGPTTVTPSHERFLAQMHDISFVSKLGRAIVEEVGSRWRKVATQLDQKWGDLGNEILHRCSQSLGPTILPCGLMHGDFTPWNSKLRDGKLLLFDWELAHFEAPLTWDRFHFQVQTATCLRRQLPVREQRTDPSYALYLLYSVARFAEAGPATQPAIEYRRKAALAELQAVPELPHLRAGICVR